MTTGMIGLALITLTAGILRLVQVTGGPGAMPPGSRLSDIPLTLIAPIVGAATYAVLGAFLVARASVATALRPRDIAAWAGPGTISSRRPAADRLPTREESIP